MISILINQIRAKAQEFSQAKKSWHFHILTPQCQLNTEKQFALILENATDKQTFVAYEDNPPMEIGKQLVQLLHGNDVVQDKNQSVDLPKPSLQTEIILNKAQQLNQEGKFWHHHMLFPDCIFNDSGSWLIIFEDQATGEIIKSVSKTEPKSDLKHIETLFYQQKK